MKINFKKKKRYIFGVLLLAFLVFLFFLSFFIYSSFDRKINNFIKEHEKIRLVLRRALKISDAPFIFYASFFPDNLESYHLTVRQKNYQELQDKGEAPADFQYNQEKRKVKMRLQNDSPSEKKSWHLDFDKVFKGRKTISLLAPEKQEYFLAVLANKIAQKMELPVSATKLVNLFINGKRQGVYLIKEKENQKQKEAWERLEELEDDQFFKEVERVLDLEEFLSNEARAELINTPLSPLAKRILNKPEWFFLKNKILWQYLSEQENGEKGIKAYEEITNKAKKDFYKDRLKAFTNIELLLKIKKDKARLKERYAKIINELEQSKANLYLRQKTKLNNYSERIATLEIESSGFTSIYLQELVIALEATPSSGLKFFSDKNDNFTLDPEDVLLGDFKKEEEGVYKIEPEKKLVIIYTAREFFKGIFYPNSQSQAFFITSSQPFLIKDIKTKINNAVTNKKTKSVTTRFLDESVFQYLDKVSLTPEAFIKEYPLFKRKKDKTFVLTRGVYFINKPIVIPTGLQIEIQPGSILKFTKDTFLLSYGKIRAEGTSSNPISLTSQKADEPWGVLGLVGKGASGSKFSHIILENASEAYVNGIFFSGALAAHYADITVEESLFQNNHGDDAINVKHGQTEIRNSKFLRNEFDAIDLDSTDGLIENNLFVDNGNDAFDISFSQAHFKNNKVQKSGDKCVSVGEKSKPEIYENELEDCLIGVAVKDLSLALIYNNKILNCQTGISVYQKKEIFGGGKARIKDNQLINNEKDFEKDAVSQIEEF